MTTKKPKIVALGENLHGTEDYYLADLLKLEADLIVYSYASGCYSGDGFAVWKKGRKWFYTSLGHCSCNGPFDNLTTSKEAGFTLAEVKSVATENNYGVHAVVVVAYLNKMKKK